MVFVYGANAAGIHGAGAALYAKLHHGAVLGYGIGRKGNSYGIPTKDTKIKTLPIKEIRRYVQSFLSYARHHSHEQFQVTAIGCGLAGFTHEQMAPLFNQAPENCWFDTLWEPYLGSGYKYWGTYDESSRQYQYSEQYKSFIEIQPVNQPVNI